MAALPTFNFHFFLPHLVVVVVVVVVVVPINSPIRAGIRFVKLSSMSPFSMILSKFSKEKGDFQKILRNRVFRTAPRKLPILLYLIQHVFLCYRVLNDGQRTVFCARRKPNESDEKLCLGQQEPGKSDPRVPTINAVFIALSLTLPLPHAFSP